MQTVSIKRIGYIIDAIYFLSAIAPYLFKPRDVPLAVHAKFFGLVETTNMERKKLLRAKEKTDEGVTSTSRVARGNGRQESAHD